MKSRSIKLIIFFTAIALIGLILTQTLWIRTAMEINEKQFEHRAQTALSNTVNEIKFSLDSLKIDSIAKKFDNGVLHVLVPKRVNCLLRKYLYHVKLDTSFQFALVKVSNDSIIFQTKHFTNKCPNHKIYYHNVSYIYPRENYMLELMFPKLNKYFMGKVWSWLLMSGFFLILIVFCFSFIVFAVFRHKKVSDMKTDFINNMTHEFKTPLSTISLASEILINTNAETNIEKIHRYARIINEENIRMQSQVDQVLRMAQLDKGEYVINKEETDIHELITNSVNNLCLEHCEREVIVDFQLNADKHILMVDPIHISNVIKNLVENAYKYSPDKPTISIATAGNSSGIVISVKDNGLGISPEKQKLVFDKFYRVPTGDVHDVKGFGIGLYYVKVIVDAHSGKVSVKSEQGKGSRFDIYIPYI